mgnify:CR=1 FL=1
MGVAPSQKQIAVVETGDGFGQSLIDDVRFLWRFRSCRALPVVWRLPHQGEAASIEADPLFGRFGDCTEGVAEADGRLWVVRSRLWHGWPDPPEFVFFAREPDGSIWCARDFHTWPGAWTRPEKPN